MDSDMAKRKSLDEWKEELIGKVFSRLTVLDVKPCVRKSTGKKDGYCVVCKCICGNLVEIPTSSLVRSLTKSCGCLNLETKQKTIKKARSYLNEHPECYLKNRENSIKALKKWREEHPEEVQKNINKMYLWHKEHPEESKAIKNYALEKYKEWRKNNSEKARSISINALKKARLWRKENPEKVRESLDKLRKWRVDNKVKYNNIVRNQLKNSSSSEERELNEYLESLGYPVDRQFLVEGHYFDFKVGTFLLEYHGSVYHYTKFENLNNPKAKEPPTQKRENNYHVFLRDIAEKNNYHLIQVWDYNWFNKKEFVKNLIKEQLDGIANYRDYVEDGLLNNDYGFSIDGEYIEPKSLWISTWYRKIVDESYTKGKVLVYNSGYTKIKNQEL